jgi:carboxyl-terminal processing protease
VVAGSFLGGTRLRTMAHSGLNLSRNRVTSLPEAGLGSAAGSAEMQDGNPGDTFQEVLRYVQNDYVDKVKDTRKLGYGAVRTMLAALDDPQTRFLEPQQKKQFDEQLAGRFSGFGMVTTVVKVKQGEIEQRRLAVVAPALGGPADKAGIHAGDIITEIDGRWIIAYDPRLYIDRKPKDGAPEDEKAFRQAFRDAAKRLVDGMTLPKALETVATAGRPTTLTIERPGQKEPIKVTLNPAPVSVQPAEFKAVNDRTAYLRVTLFNAASADMITKSLSTSRHKAVILDLRDNPGGPIGDTKSGAMSAANALITALGRGGSAGVLVRRSQKTEPIVFTASTATPRKVVVLVNKGTANLAEFVTAVLKEQSAATIVGASTFGDASGIRYLSLRDGSGMLVNSGHLRTAKGLDPSSKGITPDVPVATGGPKSSSDAAYERAVSVAGA